MYDSFLIYLLTDFLCMDMCIPKKQKSEPRSSTRGKIVLNPCAISPPPHPRKISCF